VLSAKVVNQGSVPLTKVPIVFYLDGSKVYNTSFDLSAGASKTIVFNMTDSVSTGQHVVRIELDPANQFARFAGGGTVFTETVYVNPPDYGSTDGLLILLFVMLILVTYLVYKRPKRRKRSS
jgi:subtilase family serine protease